MVNGLDYEGIKFPFSKKDYSKIEQKHNIRVNVFCYENNSTYPFMYQMKNLRIVWIYCWWQMEINLIMSISKILTDLCVIR